MFGADFAILVAVAVIETCLAHAALRCAATDSILPRGPNRNLKVGPCRDCPHPPLSTFIGRTTEEGSAEARPFPWRAAVSVTVTDKPKVALWPPKSRSLAVASGLLNGECVSARLLVGPEHLAGRFTYTKSLPFVRDRCRGAPDEGP